MIWETTVEIIAEGICFQTAAKRRMVSPLKNNLPVWKRDGSWVYQECFNVLNPPPPHTHLVGKQLYFSHTMLASYSIKYYAIKCYSLHWNILGWEPEIFWQWFWILILTANLFFFGHNTDPKKTKSINRFRKDTFIPNKQTEGLVNLLHTQVHLSKSLVLEHEWYHKQKLSQSWFIYFPGHLQAIGRNKMLP